jgi:hypothetical protein
MLIASKYEDVVPIYLHTMSQKVAHNKLSEKQITTMEREVLATLKWRLSSCPTSLEFLDLFLADSIFANHSESAYIRKMALFLTTMCLHHIQFCTRDASIIAAGCIATALNLRDY